MSNYGSAYTTTSELAGGVLAGMLVFFIILGIICLAIGVISIIATWKILSKAGKPGWGSLIPIYREYLLCDITGVSPWWLLITLVGAPIVSCIPVLGGLVAFAASIYFAILLNVSLSRSFGKEDTYAIGLILASVIFMPMLGFGKSEYVGKKPMDDIIFKKSSDMNQNTNTTSSDVVYCSACGAKSEKGTKFCPSCGSEIK